MLQLVRELQLVSESFERTEHLVRALKPFLRILAESFAHDLLKLTPDVLRLAREWRLLVLNDRRDHFSWRVSGEWRMPGDHFIDHNAEAPDVSALIGRYATRLLW